MTDAIETVRRLVEALAFWGRHGIPSETTSAAMKDACTLLAQMQQEAQAAPAGEWVMVPREPTPEMRAAAHAAWMQATQDALDSDPGSEADGPHSNLAAAYRAMLAAAPPQAAQEPADEAPEWVLYEHHDGRYAAAPSVEAARAFTDGEPQWHLLGPVAAQAAPAGEWVTVPREPTAAMLSAADKVIDSDPRFVAAAYRFMLAAAPPQATQHTSVALTPLQREDTAAGAEQQREAEAAQDDAIDYAEAHADLYNDCTPERASIVNAVYWGMRFKERQARKQAAQEPTRRAKLVDETRRVVWEKFRHSREVLAQEPAVEAQAPDSAEPVAFMFQHDEIGRCQIVPNDSKDPVGTFLALNPRYRLVGPLYIRPAVTLTDAEIPPWPESIGLADLKYAQETPDSWEPEYRREWQALQVALRNNAILRSYVRALRAILARVVGGEHE